MSKVFDSLIAAADIGEALLRIVPGAGYAVDIAHATGVISKALKQLLASKTPPQQQACLTELAQTRFEDAHTAAQRAMPSSLNDGERNCLSRYFATIPYTARRTLARPDDLSVCTVLLTQLPNSDAWYERFVPLRPAMFDRGERVVGQDLILDTLLGQGGFGEVWSAKNPFLDKFGATAVKYCADPNKIGVLKHEVKLLSALGPSEEWDKGIVKLASTGFHSDIPYILYEYVDGMDLASLINYLSEPLREDHVWRFLSMLANAIAFAHERGVVHRDIKPSNLLITNTGRAKITDFGIGSIACTRDLERESSAVRTQVTVAGAYTPLYWETDVALPGNDPRRDVYAIGVVTYQMLVNDIASSLKNYWEEELQEIRPDLSDSMLEFVERCVGTPSRRFPDCVEMKLSIDDLLGSWQRHKAAIAALVPPNDARLEELRLMEFGRDVRGGTLRRA